MNDTERAQAFLSALRGAGLDEAADAVLGLAALLAAVRREERARIVAYLRSPGARNGWVDWAADRLERGET